MKRIIFFCMFIFTLAFITYTANSESEERFADAKAGLVMRETPAASGKKICVIPNGEVVDLIEETGESVTIAGKSGKWSKVKWNDTTGWVFGGFLKSPGDFDTIPVFDRFTGKTYGFLLNEDERADELTITVYREGTFEGSCYLHGSGESKFSGKYKSAEKDHVLTFTLNGNVDGVVVAETEEKFTRKISNLKFTVSYKDEKFYGTLYIPSCEGFTGREMVEK